MAITPRRAPAALIIVCRCQSPGWSRRLPLKLAKNKYTPQQDVELGRKAAAEVRKQYPVITDKRIASYLGTLGRSPGGGRAGEPQQSVSSIRSRRST